MIKKIDEIDFYKGEYSIPGIKFRMVGKELGVTSWGMNILELEANCSGHPEHEHKKDGQEEVYLVLKGSGVLKLNDESLNMEEGDIVRVGPSSVRKVIAGSSGITFLALGGTPGEAYKS